MSNLQLNKLKIIKLSSNVIVQSNDDTSFLNKLLLTDTQVSRHNKVFACGSSANTKFSKTQLTKMAKLGGVIHNITIFGNTLSDVGKKGTDIDRNVAKEFVDKKTDMFHKTYITGESSGITLNNNDIRDIMKVIKS